MKNSSRGGCRSLYKGVRKRNWGNWVAEIHYPMRKKQLFIGSFETEEMAAKAYDAVAYYFRGRKARLNFPENIHNLPSFPDNPTVDQICLIARQSMEGGQPSRVFGLENLDTQTSSGIVPITVSQSTCQIQAPPLSIMENFDPYTSANSATAASEAGGGPTNFTLSGSFSPYDQPLVMNPSMTVADLSPIQVRLQTLDDDNFDWKSTEEITQITSRLSPPQTISSDTVPVVTVIESASKMEELREWPMYSPVNRMEEEYLTLI